jgi:hypothetical protein
MRAALLLGVAASLAACARAPAPAPKPVEPPRGIEGRYRGTARLVTGDRLCPRSGPRVYEVTGGVVTLSYSAGGRRRVPLTASIEPDGTFQASDGDGRLEGRIGGGTLEATIASSQCEHRWTLRQTP